jgi:hypothetical protein
MAILSIFSHSFILKSINFSLYLSLYFQDFLNSKVLIVYTSEHLISIKLFVYYLMS